MFGYAVQTEFNFIDQFYLLLLLLLYKNECEQRRFR